jgi:hypothetical protein
MEYDKVMSPIKPMLKPTKEGWTDVKLAKKGFYEYYEYYKGPISLELAQDQARRRSNVLKRKGLQGQIRVAFRMPNKPGVKAEYKSTRAFNYGEPIIFPGADYNEEEFQLPDHFDEIYISYFKKKPA